MNKKIQLIIFDLDGTLVDAYNAVSASVNFAMEQMDLAPIDDDTIKRSVGWGERSLLSNFVEPDDLDKVLSIYREHHKNALHSGTKFESGAKKLIKDLKADGYKLAIASNRPTRFTQVILKHLKVTGHFDHVVCADKVENPKPAGDMLIEILKNCSLNADQAVYVGDMVIDVQAAQDAEMTAISILSGSSDREDIEQAGPVRVIENVYEVRTIVDQINKNAVVV